MLYFITIFTYISQCFIILSHMKHAKLAVRKEWRKVNEGTKELSYNEVFRKGVCFPSSLLRTTKKVEICILYFLTVHTSLTQRLIMFHKFHWQDWYYTFHLIVKTYAGGRILIFFPENMVIVLIHWQKNYIHQIINLACQ